MTRSFPITRREAIAGGLRPAREPIRRRYSNSNIRAVLGGNFRRLLAQVWG